MSYNDMDNNPKANPLYKKPETNGAIFENPLSEVDPSRVRLSYWSNMLKVAIEPKLNNGSQIPEYDKNNSISAFLTPARAITLVEALKELNTTEGIESVGVLCKESMLRISKGQEFGKPGLYMIIEKVSGRDDLQPISTYIYEFGGTLNEFMVVSSNNEQKFSTVNAVDFIIFENTLTEFIKASTGALAGSVLTENSYNTNIIRDRLNAIATNLGIEVPTTRRGGGVPGRTPAGGTKPNNQSSFGGMNPPVDEKGYSGNIEDDILG